MKKCPRCSAAAPDEAVICYECLYSFELMSCVAAEPSVSVHVQESAKTTPEPVPPVGFAVPPLCLVVLDDDFGSRTFEIDSGSLYVGRTPTNDIVLNDRTVSRRHLHFFVEGGELFVEDMDATNPAKLNGKMLAGRSALTSGDVLKVRSATIEVRSIGRQ